MPSVSARNDASSPRGTPRPASGAGLAEGALLHDGRDGRLGLVEGAADDHALACGQAVGLDHERRPDLADEALAAAASSKARAAAVGMPNRRINSLANALHPSISAAARLAPKSRRPLSWKASTMPADSGASGPTTVRSIAAPGEGEQPATSVGLDREQVATSPIPPFPGRRRPRDPRALPQLPGQGVLAPATADTRIP